MKPMRELKLDGLLADGCSMLDPFINLVRLYKATDGKPCRKCPDKLECKARTIHFGSEGLTNKELARRDGISLNEVRRRKEAGVYDDE
jgi:hypothetical protein